MRQISAGDWHSAAVSSNGALYTWGSDKYGQCGLGSKVCWVYVFFIFWWLMCLCSVARRLLSRDECRRWDHVLWLMSVADRITLLFCLVLKNKFHFFKIKKLIFMFEKQLHEHEAWRKVANYHNYCKQTTLLPPYSCARRCLFRMRTPTLSKLN